MLFLNVYKINVKTYHTNENIRKIGCLEAQTRRLKTGIKQKINELTGSLFCKKYRKRKLSLLLLALLFFKIFKNFFKKLY